MLAVDGGNSKTDLALVARSGAVLALVHGPTTSHQQLPLDAALDRLGELVAEAHRQAGTRGPAIIGSFCLAGADFASDVRTLKRSIGHLSVADRVLVQNDGYAALRAGSPTGWGIVVICGAGVNALGVGPDGRHARLAGIGDLSGDWGGGYALGMAALAAAVRARDGRGPATTLSRLVPAHFGLGRPIDVTRAMYERRIPQRRLEELAPVVFDAAARDAVARGIADRLADELAVMAIAIARRLRIARREVDVVLTGGVFRASESGFMARFEERLRADVPHARIARLTAPPVLGAALIGLDQLDAGPSSESRLRREIAANIPPRFGYRSRGTPQGS